jgi:hypothetical protein
MVTAFDRGQLTITKNLLCSSRAVGLPENFHIFVALDEVALSGFSIVNPSTLFLNVSGRNYSYHEFTKVKIFIQLQLLLWNVESIMCDTDIVLLKDPRELFLDETDVEISIEDNGCDFPERRRWWLVNVGFMRVIPNDKVIELHKKWLIGSVQKTKEIDQRTLWRMLGKSQLIKREGSTLWLNTSGVLSQTKDDRCLLVHAYDPVHVQNGNTARMVRYYSIIAHRRNISEAYVTHLATVKPWNKIPFFKKNGLWFVGSDGFTCNMPSKRFYYNWANGNYNDTEEAIC